MKESIIIHITEANGITHDVEVPLGIELNIMEVCKASDIEIAGICGGMGLCATCHGYVDTEDSRLMERSEMEEEALDMAVNVQENSRLCCQLKVTESLDGISIRLAESQEVVMAV